MGANLTSAKYYNIILGGDFVHALEVRVGENSKSKWEEDGSGKFQWL